MKRLAKALALFEGVLLIGTLSLAIWAGWRTVEGVRLLRAAQAVWPGPRVDELAAEQAAAIRVAGAAELLWVSCVALGIVAALGLWRFRAIGLYSSVLLSMIYATSTAGRWYAGSPWVPMAVLVLIRLGFAGVLGRRSVWSRHGEPTTVTKPHNQMQQTRSALASWRGPRC